MSKIDSDSENVNQAEKKPLGDAPKTDNPSNTQTGTKSYFKEHRLSLVLISAAIVIAVVAMGYLIYTDFYNTGPAEQVTVDTAIEDTELTYAQRAEQLAFYDDYDGAQQLLQEGAEKAQGDAVAEAKFYEEKAFISLNAGEFEDALNFAKLTEDLVQTPRSAALVAEVAETLEDNQTAITYYSLAADRTPTEEKLPASLSAAYEYYLFRITELGGAYEE